MFLNFEKIKIIQNIRSNKTITFFFNNFTKILFSNLFLKPKQHLLPGVDI